MKGSVRSMKDVLERRLTKWQVLDDQVAGRKEAELRVITVSRQPGSRGKFVATRVAQKLDIRLFDRDLIARVAESVNMDADSVRHRDERGHSVLEQWSDILSHQRQLWPSSLNLRRLKPDRYLEHLRRVLLEIADGDGGMIVGRGANFILQPAQCLRVRIVAPLEMRVQNMARIHSVPPSVARNRILRREADRRDFARHYFGADIADPQHYDLVINMASFTMEDAARGVINAWNVLRSDQTPPN